MVLGQRLLGCPHEGEQKHQREESKDDQGCGEVASAGGQQMAVDGENQDGLDAPEDQKETADQHSRAPAMPLT